MARGRTLWQTYYDGDGPYFLVYLSAPSRMHASGFLDRVSGARMQRMGVCLTEKLSRL